KSSQSALTESSTLITSEPIRRQPDEATKSNPDEERLQRRSRTKRPSSSSETVDKEKRTVRKRIEDSLSDENYSWTELDFRDIERSLPADALEYGRSGQDRITERIWDERVIRLALLYRAAVTGEWDVAEDIFNQDTGAIISRITLLSETALHVAVGTGNNLDFVEKLVELMCERSLPLKLKDSYGNTALAVAAIVGNVKAAKILVGKNKKLPLVKNKVNYSPLLLAAKYGHREMILYLLSVTKDEAVFTGKAGARLLNLLITFDFYDVALDILNRLPKLAVEQDQYGVTALQTLAEKLTVFESGSQLGFCRRLLYRCWFTNMLILCLNICNSTIVNTVLIVSIGLVVEECDAPLPNQLRDVENLNQISNNAGELPPSDRISGAALQLQCELQWFKEVESLVQPSYKSMKNKYGRTPKMVFSERHKYLVHQGEKWMKIAASSCTVVAALIATVAFTAVFTVPGGNNSDQGIPILIQNKAFMVFAAADALALIASSVSVMMFLEILTSRYAEDDFLKALPTRLIMGLVSLFISISSMVAAFVHQVKWVWIPMILFAFMPVILFAMSQFPLLVQMISSTYGRSIFGLQSEEVIH
ncbi:ankyrin repeat-containing protein ITN1-like, partial [Benincasa hispida]|uniref:ankyrin repeat-containing protein ITN1-like n=1 Tax=Benincasa hispida TaxID=102211 RepID=UPI0018FF7F11